MSRALKRLATLPAIAASAAGLALLMRYRPELPDLPDSLSSPMTTSQLQQLVLVATWFSSGLLLLVILVRSVGALVAPAPSHPPPPSPSPPFGPRPRRRGRLGLTGSSQPGFAPPFPLTLRRVSSSEPDNGAKTDDLPPEPGRKE